MIRDEVKRALLDHGWFGDAGAYVQVDGQFGSTGKGLMASVFAALADEAAPTVVTSNAGPNSGHTAYARTHKLMNQQLPTSSMVMGALGMQAEPFCYLNAGAVIHPDILLSELDHMWRPAKVVIHPDAAIITPECTPTKHEEAIASTGKGVGMAMAQRVLRRSDAVLKNHPQLMEELDKRGVIVSKFPWKRYDRVFIETSQGFSLGIHQGFYPYTTSRECTAAQALADAVLPPQSLRQTAMVIRTFPIRVGNTDKGTSGGWYPDQTEITWDQIGINPERTSVTNRIRRVATFSGLQFKAAVQANHPDLVMLNFCNYLDKSSLDILIRDLHRWYDSTLGKPIPLLLLGFGPKMEDVRLWQR